MKNRPWLLAILMLILAVSLYFYYTADPAEIVQSVKAHLDSITESVTSKHPVKQTIPSIKASESKQATVANLPKTATTELAKVPEQETAAIKIPIQPWETSTGAQVLFVKASSIPMVDIQIGFNAGSARDLDKPGLAMLLSRLIDKGTETLDTNQIAEKFEDAGVQFGTNVDRDMTSIGIRSLTSPESLNATIELLSTLLGNVAFPDAAFNLEKKLMLVELKQKEQEPNTTAAKAFFAALYPKHPYGQPVFGTEAGIAAITKNDLVQFHQEFMVAKNATITIVGDLSLEQAKQISNQLTQKLPAGKTAAMLASVPKLAAPTVVNIAFPSEQTHVLLGQPCAIKGDPDYFALMLGNYILGGNFLNSRLFKEVREDRGLVYSIGSAVRSYQQAGPFLIQLQTKNSQATEAIAVVNQTLERFVKEGPTEQEVAEAKQGIISAFPLDISNNAKIAEVVSTIGFYKLPLNYLDAYQEQVKKISVADIKAAFQRRVDPATMALITVGTTAH